MIAARKEKKKKNNFSSWLNDLSSRLADSEDSEAGLEVDQAQHFRARAELELSKSSPSFKVESELFIYLGRAFNEPRLIFTSAPKRAMAAKKYL